MADDKSMGGTSEPCGHSYQMFQFWFLSMWLLPVRYAMLLYECGWILYACPAEGFISATNPWVCEHHLVMGFHLQLSPAAQLSSLSYTASFCFLQSHSSLSSLQLAPPRHFDFLILLVTNDSFTIFLSCLLQSICICFLFYLSLFFHMNTLSFLLRSFPFIFPGLSHFFFNGGYFGLLPLPSCFAQKHS